MVVIKDRTVIQDLGTDFFRDIDQNAKGLTIFRGAVYNTSLSFIKKYLLPRFEKIELVIGLSDTKANTALENYLYASNEQFKLLTSLDSELRQRFEDGSLELKFSKEALVHSKVYILTNPNGDDYRAYLGSMNLSEQALKRNKEVLLCDHGKTEDLAYQEIYQAVYQDIYQTAAEFLNRKIVTGFFGQENTEKQKIYLFDQTVENLAAAKNKPTFASEDITKIKQETRQVIDVAAIKREQKAKEQVVNLIFNKSGKVKEKLNLLTDEVKRKQIFKVIYHEQESKANFDFLNRQAHEFYPKPLYVYDEDQTSLLKAPSFGSSLQESVIAQKPTKEEITDILEIVRFYRDRKQSDESQAAFSFLMYVLQSANIWKIRKIISEHKGNVDQIPVVAGLIGQGNTGKTTLLKIASNLTIGNPNNIVDGTDAMFRIKKKVKDALAAGKSPEELGKTNPLMESKKDINRNVWSFTQEYMETKSSVTPMCIDDPDISLFGASAEATLKYLANRYHGSVHPVVLFGLNDKDGGKVSISSQVGKRAYAIGQENQFKEFTVQDEEFLDFLEGIKSRQGRMVNNNVFLYLSQAIDRQLDNLSLEDYQMLTKDFLSPVKANLRRLTEDYELDVSDLETYFGEDNYDINFDKGRRNWRTLLSDKQVIEQISVTAGDDQCLIPVGVFPNRNDIKRFFDYLPPKLEICASYVSVGLTVNIDNMDKWLGVNLLREHYDEETGVKKRREELEKIERQSEFQAMYTVKYQAEQKQKEKLERRQKNPWFRLVDKFIK